MRPSYSSRKDKNRGSIPTEGWLSRLRRPLSDLNGRLRRGGLFCIFAAVLTVVRLWLGRKQDLRHGSSALRTVRAPDGNKA